MESRASIADAAKKSSLSPLERSIADITVGCDALLDVKDQALGAVGPVGLSVLADDFLRQRERPIFRFGRFLLIRFVLVHFDERRAPRGCVVQSLRGRGRLRVLFRVVFVEVGFFLRTLRQAFPVAAEFVFEQSEGGEVGPFRARDIS